MPTKRGCASSSLGCLLLAVLVMCTPLGFLVTLPAMHVWASVGTRWEFRRNVARYERIVELIKSDGLKPYEDAYYRIPEGWDQKSLPRLDGDTILKSSHDKRDRKEQWAH